MKKLVVLLFSVIVAISASFSVFAAPSPGGDEITDKYNVVVKVTDKDGKATAEYKVSINSAAKDTDSKGSVRFEDLAIGAHTIGVLKGDSLVDEIAINIQKGDKTEAVKVSDDNYNITVKSGVSTIYITLAQDGENDFSIKNANAVGNDSPDSPPLGDLSMTVVALGLVLSLAGVAITGYCRKRFN